MGMHSRRRKIVDCFNAFKIVAKNQSIVAMTFSLETAGVESSERRLDRGLDGILSSLRRLK